MDDTQNTPVDEKTGGTCPDCQGTGLESNDKMCEKCEGSGTV